MTRLRLLACGMVLGAALSAHAFSIDLVGAGTFVPGINYTSTESIVFQISPVALTSLSVTGTVINPGVNQTLDGLGFYSNGFGDSLTIHYLTQPPSTQGSTASYSGVWTYTGGTGAYANLTGGGTMSVIFDGNTLFSNHSMAGELNPVPEPATLSVVGLGLAALLRRRRR